MFGCRKIAAAEGVIKASETGRVLYIFIERGGKFRLTEAIVVGVSIAKFIFLITKWIVSNFLN